MTRRGSWNLAARLDPRDCEAFERLGELNAQCDRKPKAAACFKRALELDPFSANTHAHLGYLCVKQGRRQEALTHLRRAEVLAGEHDLAVQQALWMAYSDMRLASAAASHCENMIALARQQGANPELLRPLCATAAQLRARLTPAYFTNPPPADYGPVALARIVQGKLTPAEAALAANPLASTPEMDRWASELTSGATNEVDKAQMLFEALTSRLEPAGYYRALTARQVFAAWNDRAASFQCQAYAHLYVALARAVGLRAYFADVNEACDGQTAVHACAAVYIGGRALLVDPIYFWFGAPHRRFAVLDDLRAIADYLCSVADPRLPQIACKLAPGFAKAQIVLAAALARQGRWKEAAAELPTPERLGPDAWMSCCVRAQFALHEGKAEAAIGLLREATEASPSWGKAHMLLGSTYAGAHRLQEARESLQSAMKCLLTVEESQEAQAELAAVDRDLQRGVTTTDSSQ